MAFAATLILCELAARVVDGEPVLALRLPAPRPPAQAAKPLDPTIGAGALPADVDPAWINAAPPTLERSAVDAELLRRSRAARRLHVRPFEIFRIWNRHFVERFGCTPGSLLRRLPAPLLVFDPPESRAQPVFRYLPSQTLPEGMVTNRFGWRGPDIPIDKPPGTVRIAFVGASTTVGLHSLPFSYPEYVVHWLNLWAVRAHLAVRFDGINAGREGLKSNGIAAVTRQEVLPAEPDLVIYYEGANESLCVRPAPGAPARPQKSGLWGYVGRFVAAARDRSQLARRLEAAVRRLQARGGYEPTKPTPDARWLTGLEQVNPDITQRRDLPREIRGILASLESARLPLEASGSELGVSSFAWLVFDGLRLDPVRHSPIYRHLNERCWPYRYADLRRWVDLHNHVLEQYAATHGLPFIDVARAFPLDPELFFDAVHLNAEGTRVHAWIVFQALIPIVRAHLESGAWPRPDKTAQSVHPALTPAQVFTLSCDRRPAGD